MGHGLEKCIVFIFLKMHYFKWKNCLSLFDILYFLQEGLVTTSRLM